MYSNRNSNQQPNSSEASGVPLDQAKDVFEKIFGGEVILEAPVGATKIPKEVLDTMIETILGGNTLMTVLQTFIEALAELTAHPDFTPEWLESNKDKFATPCGRPGCDCHVGRNMKLFDFLKFNATDKAKIVEMIKADAKNKKNQPPFAG